MRQLPHHLAYLGSLTPDHSGEPIGDLLRQVDNLSILGLQRTVSETDLHNKGDRS